GMAKGQQLPDGLGIAPAQAGTVLDRLLGSDFESSQIAVSTVELERRFAPLSISELAERIASAPPRAPKGRARPALTTPYVAATTPLEQDLVALWSEFIGVSPVGVEDSLFELGGDSLLAVQLLARVHRQYGVELPMKAFLTQPVVSTLALLIETQLIEQIEASSSVAAPE
ncbi:MAG: phosphopantetheine-binding protein, partial [Polyangiaceae bacterium]